MIVNRNDFRLVNESSGYGVGFQILNTSSFDQQEVDLVLELLKRRRENFGHGVVAIDCGANIGVHTVEWARMMHDWGRVTAFEAQERIFYALAGNVALNNCLNATARHAAVGAQCGSIDMPEPNYLVPGSYGSLGLRGGTNAEYIGQPIDYAKTRPVPLVSIDSLALPRLDFLKIDVEGMEEEVLEGARNTIRACKPNILVEYIKTDQAKIVQFLVEEQYKFFQLGINFLCIHQTDPLAARIELNGNVLTM